MTRVLVADDHPAFRRGLELMLSEVNGLEVVGLADTGVRAVEMAASHPDVVLMDLRMPDLDGIEATRQIKHSDPAPAIVVLTMFRTTTPFSLPSCRRAATYTREPTRTRSSGRSGP